MGRLLVCVLASVAAWFLLRHFAPSFMGGLGEGVKVVLALAIFFVAHHLTGK